MTRVVPDQKSKFESEELFKKLSKESEIRYTGYRDRSHEERVLRFQSECREGKCPISFSASGTNLILFLGPKLKDKAKSPSKEFLDFDQEPGKVHLRSRFIMNGVCVTFIGWMDVERLDGAGLLEMDGDQAIVEEKIFRETIEQTRLRMQEFQERQQLVKQEPLDAVDSSFGQQEGEYEVRLHNT